MLLSRKSFVVAIAAFFAVGFIGFASPLIHSQSLPMVTLEPSFAQISTPEPLENKGKFLEQLNLSEPQKQQISSIRQKYRGQIEQLQEQTMEAQKELFDMMAGTQSIDAIRSKREETASLREKLGNLRFESMLEMREVLTPQQRAQVAQRLQQRREDWRSRFGDRFNKNWF
ncbi:MAG: Spy/CpxP family protein refolding chaperone [Hydrococcus sp. Prado102]|jgi:Spy/CpxP family protein refolding chaperone|nr:Spy/CpxP family protein refolding chaperone [Hydrococcus sp. Prado102]